MRLDDARLCLDCEEIHEEQHCPACGSEAFGFLTRWIQSTSPSRASMGHVPASTHGRANPTQDHLAAWRQISDGTVPGPVRGKKIVTRSLLGLAAMGIAGWAWAKTSKDEES
jgi:hypothetical protein